MLIPNPARLPNTRASGAPGLLRLDVRLAHELAQSLSLFSHVPAALNIRRYAGWVMAFAVGKQCRMR
jgi:hypothetical protein